MNCPFYGRHFVWWGETMLAGRALTPFNLIGSGGNQCGLVAGAFSPCYMEQQGRPVDWRECDRVKEIRIGG